MLLGFFFFSQHQLRLLEAQKRQQELILRRKTEEVSSVCHNDKQCTFLKLCSHFLVCVCVSR